MKRHDPSTFRRISPRDGASRIEAFSHAVFGFALTLLVVSLEVPRSFDDLVSAMSGFVGFAGCFAIFIWIWVEHYRFFRRSPLADGWTIALNSALLFVVLFYVYPMKFIFTLLGGGLVSASGVPTLSPILTLGQTRPLMVIYGVGFVAVFTVLAALYAHVLRSRERLGLSALQAFDAKTGPAAHTASIGVGLLAIATALAMPLFLAGPSGMVYALLGPVHFTIGARRARARAQLEASAAPAADDVAITT